MQLTKTSFLSEIFSEIRATLGKHYLATTFSWQDIAQRYRRSRVGAFWLTINMGVLIGALGIVFGTLFRAPMDEFLPYICVSLIVWGYMSTTINEGCTAFISAEGIILQVRAPLLIHILRILYKNAIIFCHNIIIFPIILLIFWKPPSIYIIYMIPGFLLVSLNVSWIMLIVSIVCTRYRDMIQIVQNILQVLFYATPIMWMPKTLPEEKAFILEFNPFYHLVNLVRSPLLGESPSIQTWVICLIMAVIGWTVALGFFFRYRQRIAYWL